MIEDPVLSQQYQANWQRRQAVSEPYAGALPGSETPEE
jgi:hypothetical protein